MMQSGMAYETGTLELSGVRTVDIPHSLPSDNIIGILQRRNSEETLGTNNTNMVVIIPPDLQKATLNTTNYRATGVWLVGETRTTSATGLYKIMLGSSIDYSPRPSFHVITRTVNYLLNGIYDYVLIATDVYRPRGVPLVKKELILSSSQSTILLANPFGSSTGVLALATKKETVYGVNGLNGGLMFNTVPERYSAYMVLETRATFSDYSVAYDMRSHSMTDNEIHFGARNGNYPYLPGDYDILLIKYPPFE